MSKYSGQYYTGTLTDDSIDKLLALKKVDPMKGLPFLFDCVYNIDEDTVKLIQSTGKQYFELYDNEPEKCTLRAYQTINIAYGYYAKKALLGDAIGLGKTHIAGGIINLLKKEDINNKFLVLCEKNALYQIYDKLTSLTGLVLGVTTGEQKEVERTLANMYKYDGLVGTHSLIENTLFMTHMAYDCRFKGLIYDESANVKNIKTPQAQNLILLVNKIEYATFLNATPVEMDILDLANQIRILDSTLPPAKTTIEKEVCKYDYRPMIPKKIGYKEDKLAEMRVKLSLRYNGYSRQMLTGYNISDHNYIEVVLTKKTAKQRELIKNKHNWQMVYSAPYLVDPDIVIDEESVPKIEALLEIMTTKLKGKKTLIYCKYKSIQHVISGLLNDKGINTRVLNGETDALKRRELNQTFNSGDIDCLVSNVLRSVDLPNGDAVIYYTLETNPSKMKQIEGRILRELEPKGKEFYVLLTEHSEETKILKGWMQSRDRMAQLVVNLDDGILKECVLQLHQLEEKTRKGTKYEEQIQIGTGT